MKHNIDLNRMETLATRILVHQFEKLIITEYSL